MHGFSFAGLQSRQFLAHAGDARADQRLVADEPEGGADQDRREGGEARSLRRVSDGRGRHPTADVPRDFAADFGTTAAATTSASVRRSIVMRSQAIDGRSAPAQLTSRISLNFQSNGRRSPRSGRGGRRFKSCRSDQDLAENKYRPANPSANPTRNARRTFECGMLAIGQRPQRILNAAAQNSAIAPRLYELCWSILGHTGSFGRG
jgi:hypothetical protein